MSIRRKTIILMLVMVVGLSTGTPLSFAAASGNGKNCVMKCCKKKAKAKEENHSHGSKNFCRVSNCFEIVPAAPAGSSHSHSFGVIGNDVEIEKTHSDDEFESDLGISSSQVTPYSPNAPPIYLTNRSLLL